MRFLQDPVERLLYISLAVLLITIGIAAAIIAITLNSSAAQSKAIQEVVQRTNDHVDCVALLLSQSDRGNLRITDLQKCQIGQ